MSLGGAFTLDNLDLFPMRLPTVVFRVLPNGEMVLLNTENAYYYSSNRMGARVWAMCDGKTSVHQMVVEIAKQFDIPAETCSEDVLEYVDDLRKEGLVKVNDYSI